MSYPFEIRYYKHQKLVLVIECPLQKQRAPLWGFSIYSISCCNTKISSSAFCLADVRRIVPSVAKGRWWLEAEAAVEDEECVGVRTFLCFHDSQARHDKGLLR